MTSLYLGDCLDVLATLADASIDLVCADPPYGTTKSPHDTPIDPAKLWAQLRRVCKPSAAILLFCAQPFTTDLAQSNRRDLRYDLVWAKDRGGSSGHLNAKRMPLRRHETILVFYRRQPVYHPQWEEGEPNHSRGKGAAYAKQTVYGAHGMVEVDPEERRKHPGSWPSFPAVPRSKRLHPQEKPVPLLEYLMRTYSDPGAVVLDFAMGSGSAAEAARNTGRRFVGIEKDADIYARAVARAERIGSVETAAADPSPDGTRRPAGRTGIAGTLEAAD